MLITGILIFEIIMGNMSIVDQSSVKESCSEGVKSSWKLLGKVNYEFPKMLIWEKVHEAVSE